MKRRAFIETAAMSGMCLCNAMADAESSNCNSCETPELEPESYTLTEKSITIDLRKTTSLQETNSAAAIAEREKMIHIIIVKTGKKEYVALHRLCTHGRQFISYNSKRKVLQCNSYNHAIFALNGEVIKGPAPKPLKAYPITVSGNTLEITLTGEA